MLHLNSYNNLFPCWIYQSSSHTLQPEEASNTQTNQWMGSFPKGNSRDIVDGTKGVGQQTHVFDSSQQRVRVLLSNVIQESKFCFEICRKLNGCKLEKRRKTWNSLHSPSHLSAPISTSYPRPGQPNSTFLPQIVLLKMRLYFKKKKKKMRLCIKKHRNKYIWIPYRMLSAGLRFSGFAHLTNRDSS